MALQVWLPLNGNARNIGIDSKDMISSGTLTYQDDYLTAGSGNLTMDYTMNSTTTDYSICFWANMNSTGRMVFGTNSSNNWCIYFTSKICANVGDSAESYFNKVPVANEWHHYVVTISNKVIKLYIDGIYNSNCAKYHDINCTKIRISGWFANTNYKWDGKVKDFRIYDECLSPKQIKEISKGLVAHYKLAMPGMDNILVNTDNGLSSWVRSAANGTSGSGSLVIENGEKIRRIDVATASTSWQYDYYSLNNDIRNGLKTNTTYTVSFDLKANFSCNIISQIKNGNATNTMANNIDSFTYDGSETWKHVVIHMKTISDFSTIEIGGQVLYFIGFNKVGYYMIKNLKMELNDHDTPWLPNKADTLYTQLGYDKILSQDSSGYGYHGTIGGILRNQDNTPRYNTCSYFGSSDTGYLHQLSTPINASLDSFTYSLWFYSATGSNAALYNCRTAVGEGFSLFLLNTTHLRFDTGASAQWDVGAPITEKNKWYHIAITYNKNTGKKCYINGKLFNSTTTPGTLSTVSTVASIGISSAGSNGSGNQLYGAISDARLYCTELSVDDILTLYKTGGIIDNKGNSYAYEFVEEC